MSIDSYNIQLETEIDKLIEEKKEKYTDKCCFELSEKVAKVFKKYAAT